ncbi:MAG: RNA recognition motif domain-containing protein [Gammaproteobacteria bacterium]
MGAARLAIFDLFQPKTLIYKPFLCFSLFLFSSTWYKEKLFCGWRQLSLAALITLSGLFIVYFFREIVMSQNKLYVGNFPYSVNEDQLRGIFSQYGEISELALIMDRDTGRPKGFGFITFATQEAAEKALEQNGNDLDGRPLKVNMAIDKPRGGSGGQRPRW